MPGIYKSLAQGKMMGPESQLAGPMPGADNGIPGGTAMPPPGGPPPAAGSSPGSGLPGAPGGDPVSAALANLNNILMGVADGQIPLTPQAEGELKVLLSLLGAIAKKGGGNQGAPPPAMSQAGPGNTQLPGGGASPPPMMG